MIRKKMLLKSLYLCNGIQSTAIRNASGSCVVYIVPESAAFFRAEDEGRTTVVGVTSTRKQYYFCPLKVMCKRNTRCNAHKAKHLSVRHSTMLIRPSA